MLLCITPHNSLFMMILYMTTTHYSTASLNLLLKNCSQTKADIDNVVDNDNGVFFNIFHPHKKSDHTARGCGLPHSRFWCSCCWRCGKSSRREYTVNVSNFLQKSVSNNDHSKLQTSDLLFKQQFPKNST